MCVIFNIFLENPRENQYPVEIQAIKCQKIQTSFYILLKSKIIINLF